MEDLHTEYLGKTSEGMLFWGYETSVINHGEPLRKDYAVLHFFDKDGNYLSSQSEFLESSSTGNGFSMAEKLNKMVRSLGKVYYRDITIKLFQTNIDGVLFGLVPDDETEMIHLQPGSMISFEEPWDGEYYT